MKIALFGGSFNPVHNGHLAIAKLILKRKLVDEVWFIPCGDHAFDKNLAKGEDRTAMLNLAIKGKKKIKINDLETKRSGKSYTIQTLKDLKKQYAHKFYLVIGSDNLAKIEKWYNFSDLVKEAEFIIINRPSYDPTKPKNLRAYASISGNLEESSTQIRQLLQKNGSIKSLVPEKVEQYIQERRLYL